MMKKMKLSQKQNKPLKKVRNRNRYENKKRNKNILNHIYSIISIYSKINNRI